MKKLEYFKKVVDTALNELEERDKLVMLYENQSMVVDHIANCLVSSDVDQIALEIEFESDETCCLKARASVGGFTGKGEAWFNTHDVLEFVRGIETVDSEGIELAGGYGSSEELIRKTLSLKLYETGKKSYALTIQLADHPYTGCRDGEIRKFSGELKVGSWHLSSLAEGFNDLVFEKRSGLVFVGD